MVSRVQISNRVCPSRSVSSSRIARRVASASAAYTSATDNHRQVAACLSREPIGAAASSIKLRESPPWPKVDTLWANSPTRYEKTPARTVPEGSSNLTTAGIPGGIRTPGLLVRSHAGTFTPPSASPHSLSGSAVRTAPARTAARPVSLAFPHQFPHQHQWSVLSSTEASVHTPERDRAVAS